MAVYRRGKIWWFVFEFQGRRVQESSGFTNKTAALRAEARRKTDLLDRRAGFTKAKLAPKFEEFVGGFLKWSKQHHRPKTYDLHEWNCQTLKRFFSGKYIDEITSEMVEDFKSARKQEPLRYAKDSRLVTGATVNRALTTLKLLYHQAERSGYSNDGTMFSRYSESGQKEGWGTGGRLYFRRPTILRNQSAASRRHIEPPSCGPASRGIFGFTICVIRSQHEQWPPAQTCRRSAHCWGMRVF
jgi:hypothetical protein